MTGISDEKGIEVSPIAVIDRFGTSLVTCSNILEILQLSGEAVHSLVPEAMMYTTRLSPDGSYLQGTWQSGFDRYLKPAKQLFGIDPFEKKFSVSRMTSEELSLFRNGKLYYFAGDFAEAFYNLSFRTVSKPLCYAFEKLLHLGAIHAIGFAWDNKHYGALILMLPKGKFLTNTEAIETIVHLGSVGIQRVQAEEAIRQSEAKYRTLVEQSHEGITIASGNRIIFANDVFLQILGYDSLDELVNVSIMDIIAPESKEITLEKREQIHTGRQEYDAKLIRKNGQLRDINIKTSEIVLNGEKCIQSSFVDITERKLAEENRSRLQKLEALGILAAGIAHDFNNLLMGIFGFIECAKKKCRETSPVGELEKALACMARARVLTSRLLTFSKGGAPALKRAPLFPFVDEVLKEAVNGTAVSYTIEADSDLRHCLYDKIQLKQVLYSIARNAVDAMPAGGNIRVSAGNVAVSKSNRLGLNEGDYLHISIEDKGVGISENNFLHLFDPFFSTKSMGSGLNLAIAHSILKRHGGSIDVESVLGKGTTFHIYLKSVN